MGKYDITIRGYEDGLTENAVESMVRDLFPRAEGVEVTPSDEG